MRAVVIGGDRRRPDGAAGPRLTGQARTRSRLGGVLLRGRPAAASAAALGGHRAGARLGVLLLDEPLELVHLDPPLAAAADLDGDQLLAAHERVGLRPRDVEDLRDVVEGQEAGRGHRCLSVRSRPVCQPPRWSVATVHTRTCGWPVRANARHAASSALRTPPRRRIGMRHALAGVDPGRGARTGERAVTAVRTPGRPAPPTDRRPARRRAGSGRRAGWTSGSCSACCSCSARSCSAPASSRAADATVPVWAAAGDLAAGTELTAGDLRRGRRPPRRRRRRLPRHEHRGRRAARSPGRCAPASWCRGRRWTSRRPGPAALPVQAGYVPPGLDAGAAGRRLRRRRPGRRRPPARPTAA